MLAQAQGLAVGRDPNARLGIRNTNLEIAAGRLLGLLEVPGFLDRKYPSLIRVGFSTGEAELFTAPECHNGIRVGFGSGGKSLLDHSWH